MLEISPLIAIVMALAVTAGVLPMVIRLGVKVGAVDRPGGRRVHRGEIPRLGGVAIFLGIGTGVGAALILAGRAGTLVQPTQFEWYGPALGMLIVFAGGLLDDVFQYSAQTKFAIQVVGAAAAVVGGMIIPAVTVPGVGLLDLSWFGPVAAFGWILLVTNAMNLIDGLDGLAAGIALIIAITMAAVAGLNGQFAMVVCSCALAGAMVGFLVFNFNPARVFMGDSGSQFIGFFIAVLSIRGSQKGPTAIAITVPLMVLGLPLLDLGTTVARRLFRREAAAGAPLGLRALLRRIAHPDREHLHHNLLDHGLSPRRAVVALYAVTTMFALAAYLSVAYHNVLIALGTLFMSVTCVAAIKLLRTAGKHVQRTE